MRRAAMTRESGEALELLAAKVEQQPALIPERKVARRRKMEAKWVLVAIRYQIKASFNTID